jgi:diguanylate cyclase (GGDEF)-like protein
MTNSRPVELKLLQLRERFAAALPRRIDEIADTLSNCEAQLVPLPDLERKFHSLAGTAGTYGLAAVADLAAEGEAACSTDTPVRASDMFDYFHSLIDSMRQATTIGTAPAALRVIETKTPARIICVDDDPQHIWYLAMILKSAGYEIFTARDATEFQSLLANVRPDLIVMDYVLPDGTGIDLARLVRRDASYSTVPIVFLTGRAGVEQRIEAVNVGGDDFLTKPADPELLLSVIASRLQRSQSVRALIDRDGLTGLLNRVAFMRRAEAVIAESKRRPESSALVMLDLDRFKSINDSHGHPAGDQVISAFGSLLARSVRPGDEAGRYGGEEFALLLRNITYADAHNLVARLLGEFGHIPFRGSHADPFYVTFSAGVAMLERKTTLPGWVQHADEALYVAKQNGRARIEAA